MNGAKMIAAAVTLTISMMLQARPHMLTYYGTESDGFLGEPPGAFWNNRSCSPPAVDNFFLGTAAPRDIPYCSVLVVGYQGDSVQVVVVDRAAKDVIYGHRHLDLWPAAAEQLDMKEAGVVVGLVVPYYRLPVFGANNVH